MLASVANVYSNQTALTLDIADYPGGVAIWGALPAVIDTTDHGFDRGVHVHARLTAAGKKAIDATYSIVNVIDGDKQFVIDEKVAVNFSLASIFNHKIISLRCEYCSQPLVSSSLLSLIPHHEHICQACGHINITEQACVLNPVIELKQKLGDVNVKRKAVMPNRAIRIDYDKYPGGIQIWGSNPSIIWTARRHEESAIHVHAYASQDKRIVDNTYSEVWLGVDCLDIEMIRVWQIQRAMSDLEVKLDVVSCPDCGMAQFDIGIYAVLPHASRKCQFCRLDFITRESVISNPVIDIVRRFNKEGIYAK